MGTVYRLLSFRYLVQRWTRAALIVASIALGVATLVSTRILNQCIEAAAANTTTPMKLGDLCITNDELGVDRTIADELRAANIAGIESVQPIVVDKVELPGLVSKTTGRVPSAVIIGVELAKHQLEPKQDLFAALNGNNPLKAEFTDLRADLTLASGIRAASGKVVVLSRSVYNRWLETRSGPGEAFIVKYGNRTGEYTPVAVVDAEPGSPLLSLGEDLIGMEIDQAAKFLRPETPRVNRIDILLKPNADIATAKEATVALVGPRAKVLTAKEQGRGTQQVIGGIQIGFTMCSIGAMVVGLFLVYNALAVTVAERRHDIGILRSLGATRFQIVKIFLVAAGFLGLFGAALGVPLGMGMAQFALNLIRDEMSSMFTNAAAAPAIPTWTTVGLAFAAGLATALFASLVPAIQAASQNPADSVRRTPGGVGGGWKVAHRAVCITLVAGGVAMILSREFLPARVGAFGGMVSTLVGLLLAAPILVGVAVQLMQPILRRVLPIEARLAADNLIRSPGRTGLVIGALGAGVAVMIQTAGVGKSNEQPVTQWLDEIIQADQFVAAGNVTAAISSMCPSDAQLVKDVAAIEGVEAAAGIRYNRIGYNGTVIFLTAVDVDSFVGPSQARGPGGLPQLDKFLKLAGTRGVLISDNFAYRHGVKVGDTISLQGPRGPVELIVADTTVDYSWSQGTIFLDRAVYAEAFADKQVDIVHVFLTRKNDEAKRLALERVKAFAVEKGLVTEDRVALRKMLGELIERIYKLVNLQQIVVGIVASLGVVTSLLISVLQRKRELGLLLAVGATPGQVIMTVLYEAVLMGLLGTVMGFLIGIPLEWYVLRVVLYEESGFNFSLLLPWKQAFGIAGGAIFIATLAGFFPALQAVKTRIPDAIAYE